VILRYKLIQRRREQEILILSVFLEYLHPVASNAKPFLFEIIPYFATGGVITRGLFGQPDMEEADSVCDRLAIMDNGRILAVDTPKGLKESVGADSIVTVSATGDLDALARLLRERVEGVTKSQQVDSTIQLHVKGTAGVLPRVIAVAEQGGFNITDLSLAEPTLETVFINLTGKELRD
jgi:ABC-type uncharacterized transport system ATPase subunit